MESLKLYKVIKVVNSKDDKGAEIVKRYTNFYLRVFVNGKGINVPIQPVNFGNQSNRTAYQLLSLASEEIKDEERNVF